MHAKKIPAIIILSVLSIPASADTQFKVTKSSSLTYKIGAILGINDLITISSGQRVTVQSTTNSHCMETAIGPHDDNKLLKSGMTFLKSIVCFGAQKGSANRHYCYNAPLNGLTLYRHDAETTQKLFVQDTDWWDKWEAGEQTLMWPVEQLTIEDNSQYQIMLGELDMNLYFHRLPEALSASEQQTFMRGHDCIYQAEGKFELDDKN